MYVSEQLCKAEQDTQENTLWYQLTGRDNCRGMSSMSDDLLRFSEHASHTGGNSAPTEALDEADDAGFTPAHSCPVHGGKGDGIQGCPEPRQTLASKIQPSPCLVLLLPLSTWA